MRIKRRSRFTPRAPNFPCSVWDDPLYTLSRMAEEEPDFMQVIKDLERGNELAQKEMLFLNADNAAFFRDWKPSAAILAADPTVTLAATDKLLYRGGYTALSGGYLIIGKRVKLTVIGALTTAATPGNIGVESYFGTTDAGGTLLASSAALALTASKTAMGCWAEFWFHSVAPIGAAGSVKAIGRFSAAHNNTANNVIPDVGNPMTIPEGNPFAAYVTIDTSSNQGLNAQIKRSGSTAETWITHEILFEALN